MPMLMTTAHFSNTSVRDHNAYLYSTRRRSSQKIGLLTGKLAEEKKLLGEDVDDWKQFQEESKAGITSLRLQRIMCGYDTEVWMIIKLTQISLSLDYQDGFVRHVLQKCTYDNSNSPSPSWCSVSFVGIRDKLFPFKRPFFWQKYSDFSY